MLWGRKQNGGENIIVDEASYVHFYINRIIPSAYAISSSTTCPHPSRTTSIKQDSVRPPLLLINEGRTILGES